MILDDETTTFRVVVNQELQYSIWPTALPLPAGWQDEGMTGNKAACLEHIAAVWTDMRPLSLRRHLDACATGG